MGGEPGGGRFVDDVAALPQCAVSLGSELEHVAAVGEHRGTVRQHHGEAGTAGKAGQPCQALGIAGDIFAQMLVRAGHDEAIEFTAGELIA